MKNSIILILSIVSLIACNNDSPKKSNTDQKAAKEQRKDPIPQTISQQEVARIALLEAKQFITNAQQSNNLDLSSATKLYDKAQELYDKGEFKQAQITAVGVRHLIEELTKR